LKDDVLACADWMKNLQKNTLKMPMYITFWMKILQKKHSKNAHVHYFLDEGFAEKTL
jgi:hypothetical protein